MTALFRARVWMLVLVVSPLLLAPSASAQQVATSFEQLRSLVKPGATIYLTDASGRRTKGKLGELSASSLELLARQTGPDGRETFVTKARLTQGDVRLILLERRDPLWKGTLIGLGVGAIPGAFAGLAGCAQYNSNACVTGPILGALMIGGIGAGIGAAIDALITERTTVYYRAPSQRSSGVQVSPLFSKSGAGIQMSVRF